MRERRLWFERYGLEGVELLLDTELNRADEWRKKNGGGETTTLWPVRIGAEPTNLSEKQKALRIIV